MVQKVILTDGTELEGHILDGGNGKTIFVYLTGGVSILTGIALFGDQSKVRTIREISYGHETVYQGYTTIDSVSDEYGNCNIVMRKGDS